MIRAHGEKNAALLARRDELQRQLDDWFRSHRGATPAAQLGFLREIGYLSQSAQPFEITTRDVDAEIAQVPGPQLVVPLDNARYALNAANARWGSLYNPLYGSDVLPDAGGVRGGAYNAERGAQVVVYTAERLDRYLALDGGSHKDVRRYYLDAGRLRVEWEGGQSGGLRSPSQLVGFRGEPARPQALLFVHHQLHIELQFDPESRAGRAHPAGLCDVLLESAVTTIMDCEDAVAAVDAEDKCRLYRNWQGLMRGDLTAAFDKNGRQVNRQLDEDRRYRTPDGGECVLPGRSLMFVRHAGAHLYTSAVQLDGQAIPETFLDLAVTGLSALQDLSAKRNSRTGSIYIVKPKMHGPSEVAAAVALFADAEQWFGMPAGTLKLGIMDEERRTTLNLRACIAAARDRVVFINTGFLDRTGDEIHTCMQAGPAIRKNDFKTATWLTAYEDWNVDVGLTCGFAGRAQIGKGMWTAADAMGAMMEQKIAHPKAAANTAWVPSPAAATLHALHYHEVDVVRRQQELAGEPRAALEELLSVAVLPERELDPAEVAAELDTNVQSILGYVVRWVDAGIGCSKVPDLAGTALMEDCATLRISSQHIANWLQHKVVGEQQVRDTFARLARVVDEQNAGVPGYRSLADNPDGPAYQAALELVFEGVKAPNGYTEPVLYKHRLAAKGRGG